MVHGQRPLEGRRIVVTRAQAHASPLYGLLGAAGADVIGFPVTRIEPLDSAPLYSAIRCLHQYDWLVFTSQNAVALFWEALGAAKLDVHALGGARVAAVGPATAEALSVRQRPADLLPARFVAEGVLEAMRAAGDLRGARVLYIAAEGARDVLPAGLRASGASVDVIAAYRSVPAQQDAAPLRDRLLRGEIDLVTFTSGSTVQAFVDLVGVDAARHAPAACIGPVTSEAARGAGLVVAVEATVSTIPGLVEAILHAASAAGFIA